MKQELGIPIIISAPSGAGKTSLVAALVQKVENLVFSISHTTRSMRPSEKDGIDYHFISNEEFIKKIAEGDFLEYAKVFNNYYGTSKSWLQAELNQGKDVVLEIDWQGAAQIRTIFPKVISIFIFPPSLKILEQRLYQRGQDDRKIIQERMQQARNEMKHYHEFDYLIINDNFQEALTQLRSIIIANRQSLKRVLKNHGYLIEQMIA